MKAIGRGSLASFLAGLLSVVWYATGALIGLAVCLMLLSPWVDPPHVEVGLAVPVAFSLDAATHRLSAPSLGVDDARLQDIRGSLRFSPRSAATVAGSSLVVVAVLALFMWIVGQLRAVFRTLRDGQPFVAANATRIRRIGWALIAGELARAALTYFTTHYAMTRFVAAGVRFEARSDFDILAIVTGLIILVIAEVFRAGTRLDEDQALTV